MTGTSSAPRASHQTGRVGDLSFNEIFRELLADVLDRGRRVPIGESLSIASGRETLELLHRGFDLPRPRDRLLQHPLRPVNLSHAVGRFLWMMAGSQDLARIRFYEPKVEAFSDDGVTVPGSSDGYRVIGCGPPGGQLEAVIGLLAGETNTRRATLAVYHPSDAGRESRDIPCTIAISLNARDDGLHVATVMRANNLLTLLPYDLFEFSLLGEYVAARLGIDLAGYHHFMVSAHVYADDATRAAAVADAFVAPSTPMAPMPADGLHESLDLVFALDERCRSGELSAGEAREWLQRLDGSLDPWWADFGRIVLMRAHEVAGDAEARAGAAEGLGEPFRTVAAL